MTEERSVPGVFVNELAGVPPAIVGVETALPLFVGYTEKAAEGELDLGLQPVRIDSLGDYARSFGGAPAGRYSLVADARAVPQGWRVLGAVGSSGEPLLLAEEQAARFLLFDSLRLFFENGGQECYIVSCGAYEEGPVAADRLLAGLAAAAKIGGPTLLAVPDAVLLDPAGNRQVILAMLEQAAGLGDRFALIDVPDLRADSPFDGVIGGFRANLAGTAGDTLGYGAAYFPFLDTTIVAPDEIDAAAMLGVEPGGSIATEAAPLVLAARNRLPPSGALAGVYAFVDSNVGVWQAPADAAVAGALAPSRPLSDAQLQGLNVSAADGLSINAIRAVPGRGAVVWGARTLDGNSQDWRYVPVRRMIIYVQQSVKEGLAGFTFEPNAAATWTLVAATVENFLAGLWRAGGLAGAGAQDAFAVSVGLGRTMTAQDILDGRMLVEVLLAVLRPAEFISLTFEQQMAAPS